MATAFRWAVIEIVVIATPSALLLTRVASQKVTSFHTTKEQAIASAGARAELGIRSFVAQLAYDVQPSAHIEKIAEEPA